MTTYKPADYASVSPYLLLEDVQGVIDFLKATFDAVPLRRVERPDGSIIHAEVKIDDTVIMMAQSGNAIVPNESVIHVYVPDVDETYRRGLAAGAKPIQEPQKKDDADRRGGFQDLAGNAWWVATQIDPE